MDLDTVMGLSRLDSCIVSWQVNFSCSWSQCKRSTREGRKTEIILGQDKSSNFRRSSKIKPEIVARENVPQPYGGDRTTRRL